MATFDNNFRSGYIVRINWWVNSQDIANNCTNITVQAQLISTGSSYTIRASAVKNGTLNIDGTNYNFTFNASLSGNQTKTVYEQTVNIYHNGDGTRSCYMGLDLGIEVTLSGKHWGTVSTSGTATFNTIPRKSTITGISGDWIGSDMTVTIDQKSSSFTTSVFVKTPNSDWENVVWKASGTSFTFTLPLSLLNSLPQATECNGIVKVRTYNGDTEIGDDDWGKWMGVPGWVVPSIDNVSMGSDTQVNGQWMYVQNKSKLKVEVGASSLYSAWITDYKVEFDGSVYWGNNIWTNILRVDGVRTLTITVWDSRGRTASTTRDIPVNWYGNPWGSLTAYRCDANGNRDDINGTKIKVEYTGDKAWLNGSNTFSLKIDHRIQGGDWEVHNDIDTTSTTGGSTAVLNYNGEEFSLEKAYEIRLRVSDWYASTTYIVPISTAFVLMDFKAGGKGIGFGRVATTDHVAQFNMGLQIFAGRENNPNLGADIAFANVARTSQEIGVCGGTPNSDTLLNIYRFSSDDAGSRGALASYDRWNCLYLYTDQAFIASHINFINKEEVDVRKNGTASYLYFNSNNMGCWNDKVGIGWRMNHSSGQLTLNASYNTESDRRVKYDFDEFSNWEDYYNFYMSLKPQTFKYNQDMKNKTHIGMVAQDVADSIVDNNLINENLCVVQCMENDAMEDGREYALSYQQFIPLNIKMIQKHEKEIQELNNTIAKQQEEIDQLKDMVNQLVNQGGK